MEAGGLPLFGAIVTCDVIGFSKKPLHAQVQVAAALCRMAEECFARLLRRVRARFICTGDGFFAVVPESSCPPRLAVRLLDFVEALQRECARYNQRHAEGPERFAFRSGLHWGPFHFIQLFEGRNAIGDGINLAARLAGLGDAFHVLISSQYKEKLELALEEETSPLTVEYRGQAVVKHGVALDVYGVREIGSQRQPRKLSASIGTATTDRSRLSRRELARPSLTRT